MAFISDELTPLKAVFSRLLLSVLSSISRSLGSALALAVFPQSLGYRV
jgi:hypothetical protein